MVGDGDLGEALGEVGCGVEHKRAQHRSEAKVNLHRAVCFLLPAL